MRVLVTGGLGYVGRVLSRRLVQEGHDVTVLTRREGAAEDGVTVVHGDLHDRDRILELVDGGGFEATCHLAAFTSVRASADDPSACFRTNVGGTMNLLAALGSAATRTGTPSRLVFASSAAVYGDAEVEPIPETTPTLPTSPYGMSKLVGEQLLDQQAATGTLGAISLRAFNVAGTVGPLRDPDTRRLIPRILSAAASGEAFPLNGDGTTVREFTHVADVADAYVLALKAATPGSHEVLNVGSGIGLQIGELLAVVGEVTGRKVNVEVRPAVPEPRSLVADVTRIREVLGWHPVRSAPWRIVAEAWAAIEGTALPSTP